MSEIINSGRIKKIRSLLRIFFVLLLIAVVTVLLVLYAPDLFKLLKDGNIDEMRQYIQGAGNEGILVIVGLQVLQTITIFFPGIPIYMCSGIVYGKIKGTIICYLTYVISNVVIYIIAKRMKESAEVLLDSKANLRIGALMSKTRKPAWLIALLCVVPIIPNGIIPYLAANAKITTKQFVKAVALGCIPGIFLFVCCGELLLTEYFWVVILMMALAIGILIVGIKFKDRMADWVEAKLEKVFKN